MKYIDVKKLKAKINKVRHDWLDDSTGLEVAESGAELGAAESILDSVDEIVTSLQQEPTSDTDVLHIKLVNLLKTYRIDEETAITLADRIADTYGVQRYMDGLCDGIKQEQPEVDLEKAIDKYFGDGGQWKSGFCVGRKGFLKFARHFYKLGLSVMRKRLADPEYNQEVIEKMKTEYPVNESNVRKEK